jgi:hypothetical protein
MDEDIHLVIKDIFSIPVSKLSKRCEGSGAALVGVQNTCPFLHVSILLTVSRNSLHQAEHRDCELVRYSLSSGNNSIAGTYRCALRDETTCLPAKEPENASDGNRDYLYERTAPLHTNYPCPEQLHFLVLLLVSK